MEPKNCVQEYYIIIYSKPFDKILSKLSPRRWIKATCSTNNQPTAACRWWLGGRQEDSIINNIIKLYKNQLLREWNTVTVTEEWLNEWSYLFFSFTIRRPTTTTPQVLRMTFLFFFAHSRPTHLMVKLQWPDKNTHIMCVYLWVLTFTHPPLLQFQQLAKYGL